MENLLFLPSWGYEQDYYSLAGICYSLVVKGKYKEKERQREAYRQYAVNKFSPQAIPLLVLTLYPIQANTEHPLDIFSNLGHDICNIYGEFITQDLTHELISSDTHSLEFVLEGPWAT